MFAPSHTVLLVTRQMLARIDLTGKRRPKVKQIWSQPGFDYESILPELNRALKLGPRPGCITVVSPDYWTDVLAIPSDVLAIAGEQEVLQALALEAEVDSGLSAFESRTSALLLEANTIDEKSWCVTQISNPHIRELTQIAKSFGTLLFAAAHPVVAELAVIGSATAAQASEGIQSWRDLSNVTQEQLEAFANNWANCLGLNPRHPLLVGSVGTPTMSQPMAWTASLAVFAFGGCGLWHWQTQQCLASAAQTIERLEKKQSQLDSTETALKAAEAKLAKLQADVAKAQTVKQITARQLDIATSMHAQNNHRWVALIDALAASTDGRCWVKTIESTSVQTVVQGVAIDSAAAHQFAGQLESLLLGSGWYATPAATAPSTNNLVEFRIELNATEKPTQANQPSEVTVVPNASTAIDLADARSMRDPFEGASHE